MSVKSVAHRILAEGDFRELRRRHSEIFPHWPGPKTDDEAEETLHLARTKLSTLPLKLRAYSHRWLTERGLPSSLPDELKPRAEQICPRIVEAVGIAIGSTNDLIKPALPIIQKAMSDAVEHAYAEGRTDPAFIRARIQEEKNKAMLSLFGRNSKGFAK